MLGYYPLAICLYAHSHAYINYLCRVSILAYEKWGCQLRLTLCTHEFHEDWVKTWFTERKPFLWLTLAVLALISLITTIFSFPWKKLMWPTYLRYVSNNQASTMAWKCICIPYLFVVHLLQNHVLLSSEIIQSNTCMSQHAVQALCL